MKELFDKIGESVKSTCKEVTGQTQETLEQVKLKAEILSLKNELKKFYQVLGEEYYHNKEDELAKQSICHKIDRILKEIKCLEEKLSNTSYKQKESFNSYKEDVKTTWNEQDRNDANRYREVEVLKICSKCDSGNATSALYCSNCGNAF